MGKHRDLIRYHLESVMQLATEDRAEMLQYLVAMALAEDDEVAAEKPTTVASFEERLMRAR